MSPLRIGIVGSGMIAGVIADAIKKIETASLAAVASRSPESAGVFARKHGVATLFETWQEMALSDLVDAIYVATPTSAKEAISLAAAEGNKHILVDKPFADTSSLDQIIDCAQANSVAFMDATHFPHHPRTAQIKDQALKSIGQPHAIRSAFFFPALDRENIRFNPEKEPTGAVGDMGWYSMRAVAEYLRPVNEITAIKGTINRDDTSGSVIAGSGFIAFADGKTTTFDFGYNTGSCLMDLDILGPRGMVRLDDFVLDWKDGFAFDNPNHQVGYTQRCGMQSPGEFEFISAEANEPQACSMIRRFVEFTREPGSKMEQTATETTRHTQNLLDAFWMAAA